MKREQDYRRIIKRAKKYKGKHPELNALLKQYEKAHLEQNRILDDYVKLAHDMGQYLTDYVKIVTPEQFSAHLVDHDMTPAVAYRLMEWFQVGKKPTREEMDELLKFGKIKVFEDGQHRQTLIHVDEL